jgi:hypothetical protein
VAAAASATGPRDGVVDPAATLTKDLVARLQLGTSEDCLETDEDTANSPSPSATDQAALSEATSTQSVASDEEYVKPAAVADVAAAGIDVPPSYVILIDSVFVTTCHTS